MDEGQGRGTPAAHAGVRLSDRPQTPSRRRRVEGCSQSQGKVRAQHAGESRSSLSCKEHQHVDLPGYGWGWWTTTIGKRDDVWANFSRMVELGALVHWPR